MPTTVVAKIDALMVTVASRLSPRVTARVHYALRRGDSLSGTEGGTACYRSDMGRLLFILSIFVLWHPSLAAAQDAPLSAEVSAAHSANYPLTLARRPLTLARGLLRFDMSVGLGAFCVVTGDAGSCGNALIPIVGGMAYGITEDLEVGTELISLWLELEAWPRTRFEEPAFYGTFRFVHGPLEVGVRAELWLPLRDSFRMQVGVPVDWKLTRALALRTGAFVDVRVEPRSTPVAMSIPVAFLVNPTNAFWVGVSSNVHFMLSQPGARFSLVVPLGGELGYAFTGASGDPAADLFGGFEIGGMEFHHGSFFVRGWVASLGVRGYCCSAH